MHALKIYKFLMRSKINVQNGQDVNIQFEKWY